MKGKITTYFKDKKYGFICGDDGKKYFFHNSYFVNQLNTQYIRKNLRVSFDESFNNKGDFANNIIVDEMSYNIESEKEYVFTNIKNGIKITKWFIGVVSFLFLSILIVFAYLGYKYIYPKFLLSGGEEVIEELYEGNPSKYYLNDELIKEYRIIVSFERGFSKFFNTKFYATYYPEEIKKPLINEVDSDIGSKYNNLTNECKKITNEEIDSFFSSNNTEYLDFSEFVNHRHSRAFVKRMPSLNRVYETSLILNNDCQAGVYAMSGVVRKDNGEEIITVDRLSIFKGNNQYLSLHKLKNYVALKDPFLHFVNEQIFYNTKTNAYVIVHTDSGVITIYSLNYINTFIDLLLKEVTNGDIQKLNYYRGFLEQDENYKAETLEEKEINGKIAHLYKKLAEDKTFVSNLNQKVERD